MEDAYPLQWPIGRPRTDPSKRQYSRFDVTPGAAQSQMLDQAFTGFAALPNPEKKRPWWIVLGVSASAAEDEIQRAYKDKARRAAETGNTALLTDLNVARDEARNR